MNEFKGTPGPWKWNDRYLGLKNRELKRDVFHFEPYEGLALRPYGESQEAKTERAANARLIASAPDLLSALLAITNSGPDAIPIKEAFEMAHRAIELARGGKV